MKKPATNAKTLVRFIGTQLLDERESTRRKIREDKERKKKKPKMKIGYGEKQKISLKSLTWSSVPDALSYEHPS